MPCARKMRGCRADCLHRALVKEYRDARDAYNAELERETLMYDTEVAEYKVSHPGITFKQWLIEKGRQQDG